MLQNEIHQYLRIVKSMGMVSVKIPPEDFDIPAGRSQTLCKNVDITLRDHRKILPVSHSINGDLCIGDRLNIVYRRKG